MNVDFPALVGCVSVSAEWVLPGVLSHILRQTPEQEARAVQHGPKVRRYCLVGPAQSHREMDCRGHGQSKR